MPSRILLPLIVACALFMENLDSTVLATALPAIAADFGENPIHLKLALTTYLLAVAVFLPAAGWLANRFGARLIFRVAIVFFGLGSIICAFSGSIGEIIFGRMVQGIGGSMMVPVGRLIVVRSVPKSELVGSMAWLTVPALLGPVTGPLLGGFLTTYYDWRWIFWINIPIGVLGLILASIFVPDIRGDQRVRFDAAGFVLAGLGLACFVTGSTTLGLGVIPVAIDLVLFAIGAGLLVGYVVYSRRVAHPLLDLSLLALPTYRLANIGGFLFRIGYGATPFLLPLLLQIGFGLTPLESGSITFLSAIGAIILKFGSVQIYRKFGFRNVLIINSLFAALMVGFPATFTVTTPLVWISAVALVAGFFRSLQFTGLNALSFADVPTERLSDATTFNSVAQQVSLSIGISVGAMALQLTSAGGAAIEAGDFVLPFLLVGLISACSVVSFWRLPHDAGHEVSGHRRPVAAEEGEPLPDPVSAARERG
jgi:EmrB/QacA subfamily drug resistance transporter